MSPRVVHWVVIVVVGLVERAVLVTWRTGILHADVHSVFFAEFPAATMKERIKE